MVNYYSTGLSYRTPHCLIFSGRGATAEISQYMTLRSNHLFSSLIHGEVEVDGSCDGETAQFQEIHSLFIWKSAPTLVSAAAPVRDPHSWCHVDLQQPKPRADTFAVHQRHRTLNSGCLKAESGSGGQPLVPTLTREYQHSQDSADQLTAHQQTYLTSR